MKDTVVIMIMIFLVAGALAFASTCNKPKELKRWTDDKNVAANANESSAEDEYIPPSVVNKVNMDQWKADWDYIIGFYRCTDAQLALVKKEVDICKETDFKSNYCYAVAKIAICTRIDEAEEAEKQGE